MGTTRSTKAKAGKHDIVSEFEAAQLIKMSPDLLRWFTKYDAKGDGQKLQFTETDKIYYFNRKDLFEFDAHLSKPWEKPPKSQRPHIPAGIQTEIKTEAEYECPVCRRQMCEIAHIEEVAKTLNNHPHNLIYLCANHHTQYDYGFKFKGITMEDVLFFKEKLLRFQSIRWALKDKQVKSYLSILNLIETIEELGKSLSTISYQKQFEEVAQTVLDWIQLKKRDLTENSISDSPEIIALINTVSIPQNKPAVQTTRSFLKLRKNIQKEYKGNSTLKECPLCESRGRTSFFDVCPVCQGEGYIDKSVTVDLSIYELVDCPVCEGEGHTSFADQCPVCHGEKQITKEQEELIDLSDYKLVNCPLCDGDGYTSFANECPACHGEKQMTKVQSDLVDLSKYELVDCPVCDGDGYTSFANECPACEGNKRMTKEQSDLVDLDKYNLVDCPLCKGKGYTPFANECPACEGNKRMTKEQSDLVDLDKYELIECPTCQGKGYTSNSYECPTCEGNKRITKEQSTWLD